MPCVGGPSREDEQRSEQQETFNAQLNELRIKNNYLSACLCAVLTECEMAGRPDIIASAQENGVIDIDQFWTEHKRQDINRLAKEVSKYSVHEREIIKTILTT